MALFFYFKNKKENLKLLISVLLKVTTLNFSKKLIIQSFNAANIFLILKAISLKQVFKIMSFYIKG